MKQITLSLLLLLLTWLPMASSAGRLVCPNDLPCDCSITEGNNKQALVIDCKGKLKDGKIPDFTQIKNSSINRLDLSSNNIIEIKKDALGLNFVNADVEGDAEILLGGNPLEDISSYAFRGIRGEVVLKLDDCGLEEIPLMSLKQIKKLKKLYLCKNKIDKLPDDAFVELDHLEYISFTENKKLGNIGDGAFAGLEESLQEINFAHTGQTRFPSKSLQGLQKLKKANFNRNEIKSLPELVFENFSTTETLFELDLNENSMTEIDQDAFKRMNTTIVISDLRLWDNALSNVDFLSDPCSLVFGVRKAAIMISANPLICDCHFYDIIRTGYFNVKGRCEGPEEFKNTLVDVLYGNDLTPTQARYAGDFGKKAESSCKANLTDWDLSCVGEPKLKPSSSLANPLPYGVCLTLPLFLASAIVYLSNNAL